MSRLGLFYTGRNNCQDTLSQTCHWLGSLLLLANRMFGSFETQGQDPEILGPDPRKELRRRGPIQTITSSKASNPAKQKQHKRRTSHLVNIQTRTTKNNQNHQKWPNPASQPSLQTKPSQASKSHQPVENNQHAQNNESLLPSPSTLNKRSCFPPKQKPGPGPYPAAFPQKSPGPGPYPARARA